MAIDVCSVVVDVPKFVQGELRALDARLNNPWTIRGGFTVPQMLGRLHQAAWKWSWIRKAEPICDPWQRWVFQKPYRTGARKLLILWTRGN